MGAQHPPKKVRSMTRAFYSYKRNAKFKKLEFNLTLSEFKNITQQICHYCGSIPSNIYRNPISKDIVADYVYNGIDRVDNTKGYVLDNCVACCRTCNWAKGKKTQEEFYHWIKQLSKYNLERFNDI